MIKLEEDEKIVAEARRHWFVMFAPVFLSALLAIAPIVLIFSLDTFLPEDIIKIKSEGSIFFLGMFVYFFWLAVLWIYLFIQWTDYYMDVWYISNNRIIDIEQKGLFHREVISLRYDKIQDATVEINGIVATFLNFGNIHVQTAGRAREIILRSASRPHEMKELIRKKQDIALTEAKPVFIEQSKNN